MYPVLLRPLERGGKTDLCSRVEGLQGFFGFKNGLGSVAANPKTLNSKNPQNPKHPKHPKRKTLKPKASAAGPKVC